MSSIKRRIVIEEYESGGFGIIEDGEQDVMGLTNGYDVIAEIINKLKGLKNGRRI